MINVDFDIKCSALCRSFNATTTVTLNWRYFILAQKYIRDGDILDWQTTCIWFSGNFAVD